MTEIRHLGPDWTIGPPRAGSQNDSPASGPIKDDENKIKWTKRRWISVLVGSKMDDPPPKELLYPGVRCRYQQNDYNTCVYKAMASVFHFAGRKDVANYLSSIAHASGTPELDAVTQVNRLCDEVRKRETVFTKIDYLKKEKGKCQVEYL